MTSSMTPLVRQVMAGLAGAAGGVLASKYISQDVTYQEPPASSGLIKPVLPPRAAQILAFGQPTATVPSPLVYRNHVLEYDSARRVPKWVAEHLTKDQVRQEVANRKGVNFSPTPWSPCSSGAQTRTTGVVGGPGATWHQQGTTSTARTA